MTSGVRTPARRATVAPLMGPIAADAFEAAIENAICRPHDLFDLDGDTMLRYRNGRVETFDSDTLCPAFEWSLVLEAAHRAASFARKDVMRIFDHPNT